MSLYFIGYSKFDDVTCAFCDQPAVANRGPGRDGFGFGICKACALKHLPGLFADATYPDQGALDAFHPGAPAHQGPPRGGREAHEGRPAGALARGRGGAGAAGRGLPHPSRGRAGWQGALEDLDDVQVHDLDLWLTNALGEKIIEEDTRLAALWPEEAAASRARRR